MSPRLDASSAIPVGYDDEPTLLGALRGGDQDAFAWLVRRYHGALLRYATMHVSDRAVAEEVVQETWLGVIRGIGAFEARSSVRTWLFTILANRARTRGAREARSVPMSALAAREVEGDEAAFGPGHFRPDDAPRWAGHWAIAPQPWNAPEARLLAAETRAVLDAAIAALPPVQREVITLRDVVGMEAEEVCRTMEITDGNQRVLLHRARTRVRAALDAYLQSGRAA